MNLIELAKAKQEIYESYTTRYEELHTECCRTIIANFRARYHNHSLEFVSGNGTCFWVLNKQIIYFDDYKFTDRRLLKHLEPLKEFQEILADCPSCRFIDIGKVS